MIYKYIIGLLMSLYITSCSTVHQKLDPETYYKRDMSIEIEGQKYEGTAVLPGKSRQEITFESAGKMNLFTFTTCFREYTQEDAHYFFNKKKIKFKYAPEKTIELTGSCLIQAAAYNTKGKHDWALLDIETPDTKLPATIKCNGKTWQSNGVSICQSREGLLQSIIFNVKVVVSPEASVRQECRNIDIKSDDGKIYFYKIPNRVCVYNFMEILKPYREHRLNTIGYEEIRIKNL